MSVKAWPSIVMAPDAGNDLFQAINDFLSAHDVAP
jgi:hypothetical protein